MATIFFCGLCEPASDPNATATYAFIVRGSDPARPPISGCSQLPSPQPTLEAAAFVGLGKALRLLADLKGAGKIALDELFILGDSRNVIDMLTGRLPCESPLLKPLRDGCRDILRQLGLDKARVKAEHMPPEQNLEAAALARAAWVGYEGKLPVRPTKSPPGRLG